LRIITRIARPIETERMFNMSEVIKALKERRSIRSFTGEPVTDKELDVILDAALYAPSAVNSQACHVTAIKGLPKIAELDAALKKASSKPGYDKYKDFVGQSGYTVNYKQAPLFLIAGADKVKSYCPKEDGALVLGNIMLAAHALGLGSVWINQLGAVADEPEFRKFLTGLGFPESHAVIGSAAIGRREGPNPPAPPRIPGRFNIV
jgi:nitroreductase